MTQVKLFTTNARGVLCGESQPACVWPDTVVAQARALHAGGMNAPAITKHLNGPSYWAVWRWVTNQTRKPAARVVAKRIKTPESFGINHQQPVRNPAPEPTASKSAPGSTDKLTDI